jgi:hypothetical protein
MTEIALGRMPAGVATRRHCFVSDPIKKEL